MRRAPNRFRRIVKHITRAARRYDSSSLAVLRRMLALRRSRGIGLEEAYFAGVLDPRLPPDRVADFVGRREFLKVLRPFNEASKDLVDDKAIFATHAQRHGLAIARTLALITPPFAADANGRPLHGQDDWLRWFHDALPPGFVIKPAVGMGGERVDVYERRGDEAWSGGRRFTADELRRRVCVEGAYGRAIVQDRLRNHAALAKLSGTEALQCTRMVTVVARSGEVEHLVAFQKLIVGGHQIDNFAGTWTGNLVVFVEPESGVLGGAFVDGAPCEVHPETGETIAGFHLPDWSAARALVERAALLFCPLRAIGWDVALTPDGPVLVEGNSEWLAFGELGFCYSTADLARLKRLF